MDDKRKSKILVGAMIAMGLVLAGFFPGHYYYKTYKTNNSVVVKGLAEMDVVANLAVWNIKFTYTGNDIVLAQVGIKKQSDLVLKFLIEKGFVVEDIKIQSLETADKQANRYGGEINGPRYILTQQINVKTSNVDMVEKALSDTGSLVAKGIVFDVGYNGPVSYLFTKLNEIKPKMLEDATKNARDSALEFAKSSGSNVGKIRKASQGVFSILPQDGQKVDEASMINKKIRVVATVEYWLD